MYLSFSYCFLYISLDQKHPESLPTLWEMQFKVRFHQAVLTIKYIDKNKILIRGKNPKPRVVAILGWGCRGVPTPARICHKCDLRMKDFCLPVHFISFLEGKLSIKWKTICISSTKGALCLWAPASPWWRLFLERVSRRHVKWSGPKSGQHCPLCVLKQDSILFWESRGWQAPYAGLQPLFRELSPQQGLSHNALPTSPRSLQRLQDWMGAWVKEGACGC